jgi:hypothetical protein
MAAQVYRATLGRKGDVLKGEELSEDQAIAARGAGVDIVVCGGNTMANCRLARRIESAVGACRHDGPHERAGVEALPHWQPLQRPPQGHSFYETERRRAIEP